MTPRSVLVTIGATTLAVAMTSAVAAATVAPSSTIVTVAGTGVAGFSGDDGPASSAQLNEPRDSAVGPDGSIYVADTFNNRIRKISPDGTITTVAGDGTTGYVDRKQRATKASLHWPHDVFVDADGVIYIADSAHHVVRRLGPSGMLTTIAGNGTIGSSGDGGPAVDARLKNPKSVVVYGGYLYIAALDNKVRRVDLDTGVITTSVGTGAAGYAGDGGPAADAMLNAPQRLQVDSQGNLYIADSGNNAVRRVDAATGIISTVAGTGIEGSNGDSGVATTIQLAKPRGIALEGDDVLYVADTSNHKVRRVDLVTGELTTVAGTTKGDSGDGGPAGEAQFDNPRGLTVTPEGNLLVADTFNSRLRSISPAAP